jgi:hypothetical protein
VVVNEWMSLDGVVQVPGAADEDTTGGFDHGGWQLRYFDDLSQKWVVENLTAAGGAGLTSRCAAEAAKSRMSVGPNRADSSQATARSVGWCSASRTFA